MSSVRSCQKLALCLTELMPGSSKYLLVPAAGQGHPRQWYNLCENMVKRRRGKVAEQEQWQWDRAHGKAPGEAGSRERAASLRVKLSPGKRESQGEGGFKIYSHYPTWICLVIN